MKKAVVLVLLCSLLFSMTACGENGSTAELPSVSSDAESEQQETYEETEKERSAQEITSDDANTESIQFEPVTVADNEACSIIIREIEEDSIWGYTLKTLLENRSADKTYMFSVQSASVNGVEADPLFAREVAAGMKANEEISFTGDKLTENGITQYNDIALSFRVYDNDDWMANPVYEDTIHVYPYGQEKAEKYVREMQPSDIMIAENEYASVAVTGYTEDSVWGYTVNLFLVNKTPDHAIMFSVDNASVNGYMIDPFFATTVNPGNCAFREMSFSDSALEENSITNIDEIAFSLRAYDADQFGAEDYMKESVILHP